MWNEDYPLQRKYGSVEYSRVEATAVRISGFNTSKQRSARTCAVFHVKVTRVEFWGLADQLAQQMEREKEAQSHVLGGGSIDLALADLSAVACMMVWWWPAG